MFTLENIMQRNKTTYIIDFHINKVIDLTSDICNVCVTGAHTQ